MGRLGSARRRFVPRIGDGLEDRVVPSAAGSAVPAAIVAPQGQPSRSAPELKERTFANALYRVDEAFADYESSWGRRTGRFLGDLLTGIAASIISPPDPMSDPSQGQADALEPTLERGDVRVLIRKIQQAAEPLPFARKRLTPHLIKPLLTPKLKPDTADHFRDLTKAAIRRYVKDGVQQGLFRYGEASR